MESIAVIHLVWLPLGLDKFKRFIESYKAFEAGEAHDLIILFNGVKEKNKTDPYHAYLSDARVPYTSYYLEKAQDIKAYHWIALQLEHTYVMFLNSYTELLSGNWLTYFMRALKKENVGIVGATGSWQSYYSTVFQSKRLAWDGDKSFDYNFRKYKLFLKALFYWRFLFKPFPNPHVRTNSFIIERKTFLAYYSFNVNTKFDAYLFESGRKGLSASLRKSGLKLLLVDRTGKVYEINDWPLSRTFARGNQENLLVSDNRTQEYEHANAAEKRKLTYLAWGKYE